MKEGTYTITNYQIINSQNQLITGQQVNYYNLRNELINIEEYIDEDSIRLGYFPKN
jgi:hypothetical protein